jgi:hypothetical protein
VFKRPISPGFKIERTVVPKIVDEFAGPGGQDRGYETAITVTKSS